MVKGQLTERIERLLSAYPESRSSDKELFIALMQNCGMGLTPEQMSIFRRMPSLESARRIRQKLQEQGKYPATKHIKKRRDEMSQVIGQNAPIASPQRMEKLFDDSSYRRMQ